METTQTKTQIKKLAKELPSRIVWTANRGGCGVAADAIYQYLKKGGIKPNIYILFSDRYEAEWYLSTKGSFLHVMIEYEPGMLIDLEGELPLNRVTIVHRDTARVVRNLVTSEPRTKHWCDGTYAMKLTKRDLDELLGTDAWNGTYVYSALNHEQKLLKRIIKILDINNDVKIQRKRYSGLYTLKLK